MDIIFAFGTGAALGFAICLIVRVPQMASIATEGIDAMATAAVSALAEKDAIIARLRRGPSWRCACGSGGNNIADAAHHVATCAVAGMNAPGEPRT